MTPQESSWVAPGAVATFTRAQWLLMLIAVATGGLLVFHLMSIFFPWSRSGSGESEPSGGGIGSTFGVPEGDPLFTDFSVSGGAISVLSPGSSSPIRISITNQNDHPVIIDRLSVTVQVKSAPRATSSLPCSVDDFFVGQFAGSFPLVIPARSMTSLADLGIPQAQWPAVEMVQSSTNQNGCQLASLSLGFAASGRPSI